MTTAGRVVLVSGGLDSAVLLAWALRHGPVAALTLDRADRPRAERRAARWLLRHYDVRDHHEVSFPAGVGRWTAGPADRSFVPGRNLFFHAGAILLARRLGYRWVAAAHTAEDASEFPDARRAWFDDLEALANRDGGDKVGILTPFARLQKADVVRLGRELEVPLERTWSCYRDGARPCRRCRACRDRRAALTASQEDPAAPRRAPRKRPGPGPAVRA